jgi:hypothetical protein
LERTYMLRALFISLTLILSIAVAGCDSQPAKSPEPEKKAAEPVIPEEYQDAATAILGSGAEVLLYGDLAKNGNQEILVANVLPNTPKSVMAGTVVTRAVVAEKQEGKWVELVRADEYLKNVKGYLALTPLTPVSGWKLQYENDAEKGMALYFTPVKTGSTERTLPIAVRWNPATKRYQSMDPSYQKFLVEAATLGNQRSSLR